MASSKVSSLTASDALAGTELFYADGLASAVATDVKVTSTQIKTWTSASPTLVTPTIDVASGTSLALGGAAIGTNALAVTGTANISGNTTVGGQILGKAGTAASQSINFGASGGGFFSSGGEVYFTGDSSNPNIAFVTTGLRIGPSASYGWRTTDAAGSTDTLLSRNAAGIIQFGTTSANAAGSLIVGAGSSSAASIGLGGSTTSGFYSVGGSGGTVTATENQTWQFSSNGGNSRPFAVNTGVGSGAISWQINPGGVATSTLSQNASGVLQFGTTAANASGAWLAAKGTLTGGTLADQANVLAITATQPTTPTATQSAITWAITSAGSASQANIGALITYAAGYTGSSTTFAMATVNSVAGTGSTLVPAAGGNNPVGNIGFSGNANPTTTGLNIGFRGLAEGGNINAGAVGYAQVVKNSATNIGVAGSAINTGTSPVHVGGFFSLNQTTVPTVSAGLIADNGAQTDAIFLARDNGATVFTIADGGIVTTTNDINVGHSAYVTDDLRVGSARSIYWLSRSVIASPSDGVILLANQASTDFGRLQFGGTTSSFPSIKRSAATLQVRLADDSGDADLKARLLQTAGFTVATLPAAGTAGRMAYVTDALAPSFLTTVVGGGAVVAPVFDNGTNWVGA